MTIEQEEVLHELDELIRPTDIEIVALRVRKQMDSGLPQLFWADLDTLLNLILGEKTND